MKLKNYYLKFKIIQDGSARISTTSLEKAKKILQMKIPVAYFDTIHTDGMVASMKTAKITNVKKESR